MVSGDANRLVICVVEGVHGGHGSQPEYLQIGVLLVHHGYQCHSYSRAASATATIVGKSQAEFLQIFLHEWLTVHTANVSLQVRRGGSVVSFDHHGLADPQLLYRLNESLAVDIDPEPRLLAQINDQAVSRVVKVVPAVHLADGQSVLVGNSGPIDIVGARHLKRVAHLGHFGAQFADTPRAKLVDQVPW